MNKFVNWLAKYYIAIILLVLILLTVYNILLRVDNSKLKEQNTQLKENIARVEEERDANWELVMERNNEIYLLRMEANEWEELFYAAIGFHPYEGYPYK